MTNERREEIKRLAAWIGGEENEDDGLSNCCCAEIIYSDICSACKEHCEPIGEE